MSTNTQTRDEATRDQIDIEKIRAEIMNLLEDTRKKEDERERLRAETVKMQAETQIQLDERERLRAEMIKMQAETQIQLDERERLRAEMIKMQAETQKLSIESKWLPFYRVALVWGSALATLVAVQGLLKWLQS